MYHRVKTNFSKGSARLRQLSDEEWFALICRETSDPDFNQFVSDMPLEQIQLKYTGASGKVTLTPAFDFYRLVKAHKSITTDCRVLDFGCGWGRITRFFVKDVEKGRLFGVDPLPDIIEICKSTVKLARFDVVEPLPPISQFSPNMFDIIYAYSVFSHLNESYTNSWFKEFSRLLKKNGLLIVTTRPRSFIEYTALLRKQDADPAPRSSVQAFVDTDQVLSDYDSGKYCHEPTGGGDTLSKDFFGETCIPKKYFVQHFSGNFILSEFIENLAFDENQACAILKKP
jgi:SAM-dependent methyltransferase